ncbi:MAG: hypothetical protein ACRD4L_01840, partial [Pyrinomonadaceae bacterium]
PVRWSALLGGTVILAWRWKLARTIVAPTNLTLDVAPKRWKIKQQKVRPVCWNVFAQKPETRHTLERHFRCQVLNRDLPNLQWPQRGDLGRVLKPIEPIEPVMNAREPLAFGAIWIPV